jgi:predicted N-acetyltransferase YhbS
MKIQIKLLIDHQEHIPALSDLWYEEISQHWNPNACRDKAKQKLIEHCNNENLPLAFIALHDEKPVGMVCLRDNDGKKPELMPWLGSLVVHPDYRGKKIGEALIETVKKKAKSFGHTILYLLAFDPTIPSWYARLGWEIIGYDALFGHRVTVMKIIV